MRSPSNRCPLERALGVALLAAALAASAGCVSTSGSDAPRRTAGAEPEARDDEPAQAREPAAETQAPIERKRGDYPEIETSETGFTITEQVRIAGDVRDEYQRALGLLRQERLEEGIGVLEAITEEAPELTAPYIDLGIARGRAGDLEAAEAALRTAAQLSPEHPIVHNELGIVYRRTGRFAEARAAYEQALSTYPGFHFARRNLAVLCDLYLADLECALEHYEAYMQSVVADEQVEIWMADVRNRLGR